MTPTEALVAVANCASASVTPAISNVVVGAQSVRYTGCPAALVVEILGIDNASDENSDGNECPSEDIVRFRVTVTRCVDMADITQGYTHGNLPAAADILAASNQQIADGVNVYRALKCCIQSMIDASTILAGKVTRLNYPPTAESADAIVLCQVALPLCCAE